MMPPFLAPADSTMVSASCRLSIMEQVITSKPIKARLLFTCGANNRLYTVEKSGDLTEITLN